MNGKGGKDLSRRSYGQPKLTLVSRIFCFLSQGSCEKRIFYSQANRNGQLFVIFL